VRVRQVGIGPPEMFLGAAMHPSMRFSEPPDSVICPPSWLDSRAHGHRKEASSVFERNAGRLFSIGSPGQHPAVQAMIAFTGLTPLRACGTVTMRRTWPTTLDPADRGANNGLATSRTVRCPRVKTATVCVPCRPQMAPGSVPALGFFESTHSKLAPVQVRRR